MRIEGSQGLEAREFNGPVMGLQQRYREGVAALGPDFTALGHQEQEDRLRSLPDFVDLLYGHTCEGMYGAPEYGGNRNLAADTLGPAAVDWGTGGASSWPQTALAPPW